MRDQKRTEAFRLRMARRISSRRIEDQARRASVARKGRTALRKEYQSLVEEMQDRSERSRLGEGAPPREDQWARFFELKKLLGDTRELQYIRFDS